MRSQRILLLSLFRRGGQILDAGLSQGSITYPCYLLSGVAIRSRHRRAAVSASPGTKAERALRVRPGPAIIATRWPDLRHKFSSVRRACSTHVRTFLTMKTYIESISVSITDIYVKQHRHSIQI